MKGRVFVLAFVLGVTAAGAAGVAIGIAAVAVVERARLALGDPIDWEGADD